jgi:hypothetical protein
MGADLVYNAGQVEPVVKMIAAVLSFCGSSGSNGDTRCAGFLLAHKQRHQQVDQQLQEALHLAGLHVTVVAQLQQQQQQQQGQCCHQYEQQQDHGRQMQHTGSPAAGSTNLLEAGQLSNNTSGGVIIWWITPAHSLREVPDAGQAQATVQNDPQQPQNWEQPQHLAEQMPQSQQQQQQQQQQPAGATEQPGGATIQAQHRPTQQPLQQRWSTKSNS